MDRNAKHAGKKCAGVYRWGCSCCMGRSHEARRKTKLAARRAARRYLKKEARKEIAG